MVKRLGDAIAWWAVVGVDLFEVSANHTDRLHIARDGPLPMLVVVWHGQSASSLSRDSEER